MSTLLEPVNDNPPDPTPAATTPEPQAPQAAPDDAPEQTTGYVPQAALHAAREQVAELKAQLAAASAKTSEVEQLRQQLQELSSRMPQPKAEPEPPAAPLLADEHADQLARTLQLFDATGAPDREAARRAAGLMASMAEVKAREAVAPIVALSAAERAAQYRQRAEQVKDADGRGVDPALLKKMFDVVPPELIGANPQVPAILTYAAAGYERMHGKRTVPAPESAPIISERAGGRTEPHTMSDFELGHLQRSGIKPKDYQESLKNYKPGMPLVLE